MDPWPDPAPARRVEPAPLTAALTAPVPAPRTVAALAALCGLGPRDLDGFRRPSAGRGFDLAVDPGNPTVATAVVLERIDGMAWWSDREAATRSLRREAPRLEGAAARVDDSPTGRLWFSDLDRGRQVMFGSPGLAPEPAALVPDGRALAWLPWRLPRALTTSGFLSHDLVSPALLASETVDSFPDPVGLWSVEVDSGAHVIEVHGVDDWLALCEQFPRVMDTPDDYRTWGVSAARSLMPDWPAVARQVDGVHISMGGLLTATGVVRGAQRAECVLEDIDSELTTWFRPVLRVRDRLGVAAHHDIQPLPT